MSRLTKMYITPGVKMSLESKKQTSIPLFALLLLLSSSAALLFLGCSDGNPVSTETPAAPVSYLSPTIANLTVSGNSISRATGGILKLGCTWTSSSSVSSATAYVAFAQGLNDPDIGPAGIIASSATSTASVSVRFQVIASTATATATATTTANASQPPTLPPEILAQNPLKFPAEVGTTNLSGVWRVEIPFPATAIASITDGKQQMLVWMSINARRTNSLAFELEFKP